MRVCVRSWRQPHTRAMAPPPPPAPPRSSHEVHVLTSILEATGCRSAHDSLTLMQCLRAYEAVLPMVRTLVSQSLHHRALNHSTICVLALLVSLTESAATSLTTPAVWHESGGRRALLSSSAPVQLARGLHNFGGVAKAACAKSADDEWSQAPWSQQQQPAIEEQQPAIEEQQPTVEEQQPTVEEQQPTHADRWATKSVCKAAATS